MAKIRVYELARDLNMTNKALIEKIRETDITVKSHMSSLDDAAEAKIRALVFGKKPEKVEVKRIKPTIIRRRKKVVAPEPDKPEPVEAAPVEDVQPSEPADATAPVVEAATPDAQPPVAGTPAEAAVPPADTLTPEKPAAVLKKPAAEGEEPARIIALKKPAPETPAPAAPPEAAPEPVVPEKPAAEDAAPPAVETPAEPPAPVGPPAAEPPPAAEQPAAEQPAVTEPKKPAKAVKKKKRSKETPAKIIKAATPGAMPRLTEDRRRPARPVGGEADAVPTAADKKKKPWRKKAEEPGQDKKFFKKKISFRRKEVIEGAALYTGKGKGRKGRKGAKGKSIQAESTQITTPKAIKRRVKIDETIALSDLAKRMGIKVNQMIAKLMGMGVMVTANQTIDFETAVLVAAEFEYEVEKASFEEETILKVEVDDPEKLIERPPVVTIMGHVDHGKTSLLDVIRKTRVTELEAGGITQHIGAYHVKTTKGQIVFLDTPGHEAFTAMRARGAKITDLVVLVVAADDGVMPQTIEAINHSRASEVPIIVAINKIDKNNADPERVLRELAEAGLVSEEWGGDTIFVKVSAKQNQGIDELLEMIQLQAELMELRADPDKHAIGHVVEARLDSGRGPVATVLIQEGTLKSSDPVVCGIHYGKVRAMLNDRGTQVDTAGPSMPVEIIGLSGVPAAGDELVALEDDKSARQVSAHRMQKQRSLELAKNSRMSLEGLFEKMQDGEVKDLNLIIKADVDGSIEALKDSLTKLSNEEVNINVIHSATGTITESDVSLATVSDAIIIGFNVRPNSKVMDLANEENVDIRFHNIIYDVIKEVKDAILGMMSSTFEEQVLGRADVREVFHVPKVGAIAGSYVTDGKIERGQLIRLLRDGIVLYEGKIASLRRFKDDVKEVQGGYECGIGIEKYNDIKVGDTVECYFMQEIKPALD